MNNKIFFYAVDPGAYSVMNAIIKRSPKNINYQWVLEGYAKDCFEEKNNKNYINLIQAKKKVMSHDIFVLGSQINTKKTALLIEELSNYKIRTFFLFDHWANYESHFHLSDNKYCFPSNILVMDKFVKKRLIEIGANSSKIYIVGHPGIEHEIKKVLSISSNTKHKIREILCISPKNKIVLLALEPLSNDFPSKFINYDEYSITVLLAKTINKLKSRNFKLLIRLHPRQSRLDFEKFLIKKKFKNVILEPKEISLSQSIAISDIIIGITSVFLIKSLILGKPTFSLQLNDIDSSEYIPYFEKIKIDTPTKIESIFLGKSSIISNENNFPIKGSYNKVWKRLIT